MKRRTSAEGFTIVESMIVLAVTGAMFIIAMVAFNGQQERTRFSQATRDAESRISDIANDVSTGYFPEAADWVCRPQSGASPQIVNQPNAGGQGTNEGCIFLGKAIHFGPDDINCANNCVTARNVTIVGNRTITPATGTREVESLAESFPGATPSDSPFVESFTLKYGLGVDRIIDENNTQMAGLAFITSLNATAANNDPVAGSQTVGLYRVTGSVGAPTTNFNNNIATIRESNRIRSATICMRGDTSASARRAAIVVTEQAAGINTLLLTDDVPVGCTV